MDLLQDNINRLERVAKLEGIPDEAIAVTINAQHNTNFNGDGVRQIRMFIDKGRDKMLLTKTHEENFKVLSKEVSEMSFESEKTAETETAD